MAGTSIHVETTPANRSINIEIQSAILRPRRDPTVINRWRPRLIDRGPLPLDDKHWSLDFPEFLTLQTDLPLA